VTRPVVVMSGGNEALRSELEMAAPDLDLIRRDPETSTALPEEAVGWLHFLPAAMTVGEELSLWKWALAEAIPALSERPPSAFVAVLPTAGLFSGREAREAVMATAAVTADLKTVASTMAPRGLRVNAVEYGAIQMSSALPRRAVDVLQQRTPSGRLGSVTELIDPIRFLLSAEASYVAGAILRVDGGWNAYSWFYPTQDI
jgi:hypothetical protein